MTPIISNQMQSRYSRAAYLFTQDVINFEMFLMGKTPSENRCVVEIRVLEDRDLEEGDLYFGDLFFFHVYQNMSGFQRDNFNCELNAANWFLTALTVCGKEVLINNKVYDPARPISPSDIIDISESW